jgi:Ni,Fe-hydrogenase III large subunit
VVDQFPRFLDEFERFLSGNEILMARTQGVGRLSRELAVSAGVTGPMLRAAGVTTICGRWIATGYTIGSSSACRWASTATLTIVT